MKKWIVTLLVLMVISTAAFFAWQIFFGLKIGSLESLVPDDAMVYIHTYNSDKKIQDLKESSLFQQFADTKLYKGIIVAGLDSINKKIPFSAQLFTKDTALALLSFESPQDKIGGFKDFVDGLFLTRLDTKRYPKLKKDIEDFFLSFTSKEYVTRSKYKGIKIYTYNQPKAARATSYAFLADVLLLSNNVDSIKRSIDLARKQATDSLYNNKDFRKATAKVKKEGLFWGYQNTRRYNQEYLRRLQRLDVPARSKRERAAQQLMNEIFKSGPFVSMTNICRDVAFYMDYDETREGVLLKGYSRFEQPKEKNHFLEFLLDTKALDKNIFNLLPEDFIFCYCGNFNFVSGYNLFKEFYTYMDKTMGSSLKDSRRPIKYSTDNSPQTLSGAIASLEDYMGVSIEKDIIPLLNRNFGVDLVGLDVAYMKFTAQNKVSGDLIQRSSLMPTVFPRLFVFLELKDVSGAQAVIDKAVHNLVTKANQSMTESQEKLKVLSGTEQKKDTAGAAQTQPAEEKTYVSLKTIDYKDIAINYCDLLDFPVLEFKPNYCIMDRYLIISPSLDLTRKIIDIYKGRAGSLSRSRDFQSIQEKLAQDYSQIGVLNIKKIIEDMRDKGFFRIPQGMSGRGQSQQMQDDLDAAIDTICNISSFTFASGLPDEEGMGSSVYIQIKGL